jgi:hypothetical protein
MTRRLNPIRRAVDAPPAARDTAVTKVPHPIAPQRKTEPDGANRPLEGGLAAPLPRDYRRQIPTSTSFVWGAVRC